MSRWREWLGRVLDVLDRVFDEVAALLRILFRGRFAPDEKSFRGDQFLELTAREVLVQRVEINAEDALQARRVIALEPERYLALVTADATYDVAGPLEQGFGKPKDAARSFVVGVVRRTTLGAARKSAIPGFLSPIEGFTFRPPDYPGLVLFFHDPAGDRTRRLRRSLLAVAVVALAWSGFDAVRAWRANLEARGQKAQADEAAMQRRISLAEHGLVETRKAVAEVDTTTARPLGEVVDRLSVVGRRLPQDAELTDLTWTPLRLDLKGRSYSPAAAELELRRGFEGTRLSFNAPIDGKPAPFAATVTWRTSSGIDVAAPAAVGQPTSQAHGR